MEAELGEENDQTHGPFPLWWCHSLDLAIRRRKPKELPDT